MAEIPSPDITRSQDAELTRSLAEEGPARTGDSDSAYPRTWGNFQLLQRLGRGGFGEVFRAWDPMLEREIALKLLLPRGQDEEQQFARLIAEARAIARVRHPNIVSVYGVDRREGRVGFWSDYVRGQTLAAWIAAHGPLSEPEAAKVGTELCNALAAVHNACLLHRDIKPGNAMRDQDGRVLLMDFGLTQELLATASLAGTPGYLAPEVRDGQPASVQSDIYAMGVLLRFLLTGSSMPVVGGPGKQKTPSHLQSIITKATETDPKARFASADQMAKALGEIVAAPAQMAQPLSTKWLFLLSLAVVVVALGFVLGPRFLKRNNAGGPASGTPAYANYLAANEALARYDKPGNTDKAIELYQAALKDSPNYALAEAGLARAYWRKFSDTSETKWADQATEAAGRAAQMNPNLAAVQMTLGSIHVDQGKFEVGSDELQKAESLDHRSADVHAALAEAYRQQGRLDDAKNEFQTAIDLDPDNWRWPYLLGALQIDSGDLTGAEKNLKAALEKSQDNARVLYDLGIVYKNQNELAKAKDVLERSVALDGRADPMLALGAVLLQQDNASGAVEIYRQAVHVNPSAYDAWGDLGTAYLSNGDRAKEATEAFRKAISLALEQVKKTPDDAYVPSVLGRYYASLQERESALPWIRKAVALAPNDPSVMERAAESYEQLGERDRAIEFIQKALKLGYSVSYAKSDPALKALRQDPNAPREIRDSN